MITDLSNCAGVSPNVFHDIEAAASFHGSCLTPISKILTKGLVNWSTTKYYGPFISVM